MMFQMIIYCTFSVPFRNYYKQTSNILFMKTQAHSNITYILNKIKMMHLVTQHWGAFELCSYVNSNKMVEFFKIVA